MSAYIPDASCTSLAQITIDAGLDFPPRVQHATIPIKTANLLSQLRGVQAVQFVSTEAGLFMIAWRPNLPSEIFSLNRTPTPIKL